MKKLRNISLDEDIDNKLKEYSNRTGIPMSRFIEKLLKEQFIKSENNKDDFNGYNKG